MPSLRDNFKELLERIRHGQELEHSSVEPIYYLVFPPRQILEVKRELPAWVAHLRNQGWEAHRFSLAQEIADILGKVSVRKIWLEADRNAPLAWDKTNKALANALAKDTLPTRLGKILKELREQKNALLLVTDLEALHPYLRIGAIENHLSGQFHVPTVFFYPGERTGKTRLKFLGFYPDDGNYRSVHVGG